MESSSASGVGFMAVFAVSGSVVFVALQLHKRLLSDFMKKIESELGYEKYQQQQTKKKVRFAHDVIEPSSNNKEYRRRHLIKPGKADQISNNASMEEDTNHTMKINRRLMYEGIIEFRTLNGQKLSNCF